MYRGGAEQKIRQYLVDNNFVDCIIQLPANLFYGTPIATCILVMRKGKKDSSVLFIDASSECIKVTNNNKLTPENIDHIVDTYVSRETIQHFSCLARYEEIVENEYNLSTSTYVESSIELQDVNIEEINSKIDEVVDNCDLLRAQIKRITQEVR